MNKIKIISLVKICAFTVFLGRAYQFYFFGAPFRAILWDESLLTPLVEGISNYSWYDYATSATVNKWIDGFTKFCSFIFLAAAVISLFWNKIYYEKLKKIIFALALFILLLYGICVVKDSNYDVLQFFELSMQYIAPILLFVNPEKLKNNKVVLAIKISIVLTFIPHGLYAMGLIYVPGHFIDMTIILLGVNETQATSFLFVVGLLDVIMSILIFIPQVSKYALIYMIIWGFITALARIVAGFNQNFLVYSIHTSAYLTVFRLAHGLVPLIALKLEKEKLIKIAQNEN